MVPLRSQLSTRSSRSPATGDLLPVFVVESHRLIRDGLGMLLESQPGLSLAGTASSYSEALERLPRSPARVAVIEARLPDGDGVDLVARLRQQRDDLAVVGISAASGTDWIRGMLKSGASACVSKRTRRQHLLHAIEAAHGGERYLCPQLLDGLLPSLVDAAPAAGESAPTVALSPREQQVARLLAEGINIKQVAAQLQISVKTAETHRKNLMNKVGAENVAGVVHYALRVGLISLG